MTPSSLRAWFKQRKSAFRQWWRQVRGKPAKYLTRERLDAFVCTVDERGGPGSPDGNAELAKVEYRTSIPVNQDLSPYSEKYFQRQLQVYQEISGRSLSQEDNELTVFDEDAHVAGENPYNVDPAALAPHFARLSEAFRHAAPRPGGKMLDMGCGWGLSSEFGAARGLEVTAVDINPAFVSLVNRRATRLNLPIRGVRSTFDDFTSDERFDLILFYECLHHAVRPWSVIHRMKSMLAPGGKIALAGEPINDAWWKHWGLRQDALSVYCIRKFGWFESGWSLDFIRRCLDRAGLETTVVRSPDPHIGLTVVAENAEWLSCDWLARNAELKGNAITLADGYSPGTLTLRTRGRALNFPHVESGQSVSIPANVPITGVRWEPLFTATPQRAAA